MGLQPSFGFGDRIGLATPGHLEALRRDGNGIGGIFAQQSIREMVRTGRSPQTVMAAAYGALADAGFNEAWGSDADHLKVEQDVDITAEQGFVFFTIDPSGQVDEHADDYSDDEAVARFSELDPAIAWVDRYIGRTITVSDGPSIEFDDVTVKRAAVKYGRAIEHAIRMAAYIAQAMRERKAEYEIELSVDETPQPTTLAEHYIIAEQCREAGVKLVSLAPRYIGDFEKGIDYKGDTGRFETSLRDHAAIAAELGPYKLSLHSGSDKLSIYECFARVTAGRYHVKTAGTSYLEALRVAARVDESLFRTIIDFSRDCFETDRATYHISATLDAAAPSADVSDTSELERAYLDEDAGRQILHVTFGSVLTHDAHGPALRSALESNPDLYRDFLATHLGRHLQELQKGAPAGG